MRWTQWRTLFYPLVDVRFHESNKNRFVIRRGFSLAVDVKTAGKGPLFVHNNKRSHKGRTHPSKDCIEYQYMSVPV